MAIFHGKIHHKWSFSIAMLNYQRVYLQWDGSKSWWIYTQKNTKPLSSERHLVTLQGCNALLRGQVLPCHVSGDGNAIGLAHGASRPMPVVKHQRKKRSTCHGESMWILNTLQHSRLDFQLWYAMIHIKYDNMHILPRKCLKIARNEAEISPKHSHSLGFFQLCSPTFQGIWGKTLRQQLSQSSTGSNQSWHSGITCGFWSQSELRQQKTRN